MEAVGANVADPGAGGGEHVGLRPVLQGRGPSRPAKRVVDMGPDAPDGSDPQGLPPQGGPSADEVTSAATSRWGSIIPTHGVGYAGGGAGNDRYLHHSLSEQNFRIYCDSYDIGAVSVGGAAPGGTGPKVVVGTGVPGIEGRSGGGEGGGDGGDRDRGYGVGRVGGQALRPMWRVTVAPNKTRDRD